MKLFDKLKSGLVGFAETLSSVDVPNTDDIEDVLSNEQKEEIDSIDIFAKKVANMPNPEKKKEKGFDKQATINEKEIANKDKQISKVETELNKDEKEIGDK